MLKHVRVSCFWLHVVFYIHGYDLVTSKRIFEYISWTIIYYIIYVIVRVTVQLERDVKSEQNQEIDTKEC